MFPQPPTTTPPGGGKAFKSSLKPPPSERGHISASVFVNMTKRTEILAQGSPQLSPLLPCTAPELPNRETGGPSIYSALSPNMLQPG